MKLIKISKNILTSLSFFYSVATFAGNSPIHMANMNKSLQKRGYIFSSNYLSPKAQIPGLAYKKFETDTEFNIIVYRQSKVTQVSLSGVRCYGQNTKMKSEQFLALITAEIKSIYPFLVGSSLPEEISNEIKFNSQSPHYYQLKGFIKVRLETLGPKCEGKKGEGVTLTLIALNSSDG